MWREFRLQEKPLFFYLIALVIACMLPLMLFSSLVVGQLQATQRQRAEGLVATQAHELQTAIDRDFNNTVQILQILAGSHALGDGDYRVFYGEASTAARRAGGHILLVDANSFDQIVNTFVPYGVELPQASATDTAAEVVRDRKPGVSPLFMGKLSKNWVFNIEIPVVQLDDSNKAQRDVKYVLILSYRTDHILKIVQEQETFPSSIAIVVDDTGRFVAHSTDHENFVGTMLPQSPDGSWSVDQAIESLGSQVILAHSDQSSSGWSVFVAAPQDALTVPYLRTWIWLAITGIGCLLLSLLLALFFARAITAPARSLAHAAAALGRGELVTMERTLIREINAVSRALDTASKQINEGRESEARLATVLSASGEAVYSLSAHDVIETWNPAAEKLFGYHADEIVGQPIDVIVPHDAQSERIQMFLRAAAGDAVTFETMRMRKGGQRFPAAITVAPIKQSANHSPGFVSVARDISDRKAHEERIRFLIAELSHRTKNLLAVIQSVARQTAINSPNIKAFQQRFGERVQAIAATHDALVSQDWRGARISQIVSSQLAALLPDRAQRATMDGEDLLLKNSVAEGLGMALHELAVNAIKHGAFANDTGRINISWSLDDGDSPQFTMTWTETGGPPAKPPETRGFGYAVMTDILERRTNGCVALEFPETGVSWRFEAPSEEILAIPTSGFTWG